MTSVRFPGKALADETGKPLIEHVWDRARACAALDDICIATDSEAIATRVAGFGGRTVMTRSDHPNGTSRLAEASAHLGLGPDDIVVNVQGDEPEIEPAVIDAAIRALTDHEDCVAGTVASPFDDAEDPANPNVVKVVTDAAGRALYFSRALIPHSRDGGGAAPLRHVGIYSYRRSFLETYESLTPTPLEETEALEQLRTLEHGFRIGVTVHPCSHVGIDTPEQYAAFVDRWKQR